MSYPLSKSDDEERNQLIKIANGSIQGEEAESILTKLFPLRSIMYTQEDCEYVLSMVYQLPPASVDMVMLAFPSQYCFSDYQED